MSAQAKNVRLDGPVLAALQEAATRRHKTLDEMASEAVMEGLKAERLNRVQALLADVLQSCNGSAEIFGLGLMQR